MYVEYEPRRWNPGSSCRKRIRLLAPSRSLRVSTRTLVMRTCCPPFFVRGLFLGRAARARHHAAGAVARHEVDQNHLAAVRLHDIVTDNIFPGVVAALHQDGR